MKVHLNKKTVRLVILGAVFLFAGYFLFYVRGILLPFVLAIVLAYILNPLVEILEHYRFSRVSALCVIYLIGILVLLLAIVYGIPVMVRELNDLAGDVPRLTMQIQDHINAAYEKYRKIPLPAGVSQVFNDNIRNFEAVIVNNIRSAMDIILSFISNLVSILLAPILAFYLLKDWEHFGRRALSIFPVNCHEKLMPLWEEMDRVLMGFIRGHLLVASIVGVLTGIGLSIVGMNYVILLSIIAAITDLIPYFGPIIGAIPIIALAFLQSGTMALRVFIVMLVVQQVESNLISPGILGESVGLHPITIVFVLLAGGALFGVLGLLLAVPVAGIARILINYGYSNLIE